MKNNGNGTSFVEKIAPLKFGTEAFVIRTVFLLLQKHHEYVFGTKDRLKRYGYVKLRTKVIYSHTAKGGQTTQYGYFFQFVYDLVASPRVSARASTKAYIVLYRLIDKLYLSIQSTQESFAHYQKEKDHEEQHRDKSFESLETYPRQVTPTLLPSSRLAVEIQKHIHASLPVQCSQTTRASSTFKRLSGIGIYSTFRQVWMTATNNATKNSNSPGVGGFFSSHHLSESHLRLRIEKSMV